MEWEKIGARESAITISRLRLRWWCGAVWYSFQKPILAGCYNSFLIRRINRQIPGELHHNKRECTWLNFFFLLLFQHVFTFVSLQDVYKYVERTRKAFFATSVLHLSQNHRAYSFCFCLFVFFNGKNERPFEWLIRDTEKKNFPLRIIQDTFETTNTLEKIVNRNEGKSLPMYRVKFYCWGGRSRGNRT